MAGLTLRLFDELRDLHGLGNIERGLIEFAAILHDIGWHISRNGHHKHSAYLITHGQLDAFSDEEVRIIANIARYHRKTPPSKSHASYASLSRRAKRTVDVGAALLRLADGLDRSHGQIVTDVRCNVGRKGVTIRPKSRGDAELEFWAAGRKAEWFKEVFKRDVEFK